MIKKNKIIALTFIIFGVIGVCCVLGGDLSLISYHRSNQEGSFIKVSDAYHDESWVNPFIITGVAKEPSLSKKGTQYRDPRTGELRERAEDKIFWKVIYVGSGVEVIYEDEQTANTFIAKTLSAAALRNSVEIIN